MAPLEDVRTALWADRCELRKKSLGQQIILELTKKENTTVFSQAIVKGFSSTIQQLSVKIDGSQL